MHHSRCKLINLLNLLFHPLSQLHWLIGLPLLLLTSLSIQSAPLKTKMELQDYRASYQLLWHGLGVGTSIHTIRHIKGEHYLVEVKSKPKLSFLPFKSFEKSEFTFTKHEFYPFNYEYQSQEKSKIKTGSIQFNWKQKKAKSLIEGKPSMEFLLSHHSQDKITLYFQLRQDIRDGKSQLSYDVIEPERIKNYTFKVTGKELLKTSLGLLETTRVEHLSENKERLTKLWLAKDLNYLIVKLQQFRKGKMSAESVIQTLETP